MIYEILTQKVITNSETTARATAARFPRRRQTEPLLGDRSLLLGRQRARQQVRTQKATESRGGSTICCFRKQTQKFGGKKKKKKEKKANPKVKPSAKSLICEVFTQSFYLESEFQRLQILLYYFILLWWHF